MNVFTDAIRVSGACMVDNIFSFQFSNVNFHLPNKGTWVICKHVKRSYNLKCIVPPPHLASRQYVLYVGRDMSLVFLHHVFERERSGLGELRVLQALQHKGDDGAQDVRVATDPLRIRTWGAHKIVMIVKSFVCFKFYFHRLQQNTLNTCRRGINDYFFPKVSLVMEWYITKQNLFCKLPPHHPPKKHGKN